MGDSKSLEYFEFNGKRKFDALTAYHAQFAVIGCYFRQLEKNSMAAIK